MAWQVLDVVEAFDPEIGKWRRLPAMPTPRCGCCAVGVGSSVVVLGGQLANGTVLDKVEVLHLPTFIGIAWHPCHHHGRGMVLLPGVMSVRE